MNNKILVSLRKKPNKQVFIYKKNEQNRKNKTKRR